MKNFITFCPYGTPWSLPRTHYISSTVSTRLPSTTLNNHSQNSTTPSCFPSTPYCYLSQIFPCCIHSNSHSTPYSLWTSLSAFGFHLYFVIRPAVAIGKSFFVFILLLPSHIPLIKSWASHIPFSWAHNRFEDFGVFLPSDTSSRHCWIF